MKDMREGRGDETMGGSVIVTRLDEVVNWGRKFSLWPLPFATACCGIEFMGVASSFFDISRFGSELLRYSPRQADLLIVAGTVTYKQGPVLRRIYEQMCDPKWVVAMGVCASSGGFYDNYCTLQGIDKIIPVDYYVAGCPPRPEGVLAAIYELQKRLGREPAER
jgi:NADH-quinone oxidoreductase subunit B